MHPLILMTVTVVASLSALTHANPAAEVRTFVSTQDAQGITQASLDSSFLKLIESYTLERVRIKANEYLASIGKRNERVQLTSEATYVYGGNQKLIIIQIIDKNGVVNLIVGGIVGSEFKRVMCLKTTPGSPPISHGPCGAKISEVFGVTF